VVLSKKKKKRFDIVIEIQMRVALKNMSKGIKTDAG